MLEKMLSDTLDYARPIRISNDPVALDELIDQVLQLEEPILALKKLRVARKRCTHCPSLQLDRGQMQQVLLNLLKNASEASPVECEIEISTGRGPEEIELEITNQGDPIPREIAEKAFTPFFTTKPKGTGLGLGLVKRVVEEHGGEVALTSDQDRGTVVRVSLPTSA